MNKTKEELIKKILNYVNDADVTYDEFKDIISAKLEEYANWKIKECLPERYVVNFTSTDDLEANSDKAESIGWNACIDQILSNKDKK